MLFQTIDTGTGRPLPVDKIVYNDQGLGRRCDKNLNAKTYGPADYER